MKKTKEKNEKSERELLAEVSDKLDKVIALLAVNGKSENEQISILKELGHDWKFIGTLTGLEPDTARMRHSAKKNQKKKPRGDK